MKKSASRAITAIGVTTTAALLAAVGVFGVNIANAAARQAAAEKVNAAAAPAYLGATNYADTLDELAADSVEAKKAADAAAAEAARVAAEQAAAAEAARVAAEQEAQRVAAEQKAAQQDEPATPSDNGDGDSGPTLCPPGTTAGAVDGDGNESNCSPNGPTGTQCVEYDANNNCTAWYKP